MDEKKKFMELRNKDMYLFFDWICEKIRGKIYRFRII